MRASSWCHIVSASCILVFAVDAQAHGHKHEFFRETDVASDVDGRAASTDPALTNPWGLVRLSDGGFVVANNHSGSASFFDRNGKKVDEVAVPPAGEGSPTGVAVNTFPKAFKLSDKGRGTTQLLFASEDGSISAWNPKVDPDNAVRVLAVKEAIYMGLAVAENDHHPYLYAANFHAGTIDVFDKRFEAVHWKNAFSDDRIPEGYAPWNIRSLGGRLYVAYAKQNEEREDEVVGPGFGFVDVFDTRGKLIRRLASGGTLNAPWGIAIAPEDFGRFGGAVLIGNFGDGRISAFGAKGKFLGQLEDENGDPISIEGLWGLEFRGANSCDEERESWKDRHEHGDKDQRLYFAAGIEDEEHGLFGYLSPDRGPDGGRGGTSISSEATAPSAGVEFQASLVGPNPVRLSNGSSVVFRLTNSRPGPVRLGIFDLAGRLVAEPARGQEITGVALVRWDGLDRDGRHVAAGHYYYRADSGVSARIGHFVILR